MLSVSVVCGCDETPPEPKSDYEKVKERLTPNEAEAIERKQVIWVKTLRGETTYIQEYEQDGKTVKREFRLTEDDRLVPIMPGRNP